MYYQNWRVCRQTKLASVRKFGEEGAMSETPPYGVALAAFLRFMEEQGFSTELVWVFREDVTNCRRRYWVRVPVPEINSVLAQLYFEQGRQNGLGVTLEVLGRLEGRSACFVYWPENEEAASYAMQGPLKLKVPAETINIIPVRWRWQWAAQCWLNRRRQCDFFSTLLPSRGALDIGREFS